jgi:hypothetical protein
VAVLIFRRPSAQNAFPFGEWLRDLNEPAVLFALDQRPEDGDFFAHVERFDSFDGRGLAEIRAVELAERFPFSRIFAHSEHDILRAAQLREWFGLSGQLSDSARAYRDKVYMKDKARFGGVATPPYVELTTPLDLYRFAVEHGYPCVVKPRWGAGARGVRILDSFADLKDFLRRTLPEQSMAEGFVAGQTFHVDGLATGGEMLFVCASAYFNSCISFMTGESTGSVLLDPSRPLWQRLVEETRKLIAAFPPAPHFAFHAEFFLDPEDRLLLCEIACRPGGSRIADMIEVAYGLNMYQQWVRRSLGLPIELPAPRPWSSAGRLFVPPRRGRLRSLPESVPFDWVVDYRPNSVPGQSWGDPDFCSANIASFIVSGPDAEQVDARLHLLDDWFREQVEWEDIPATRPA